MAFAPPPNLLKPAPPRQEAALREVTGRWDGMGGMMGARIMELIMGSCHDGPGQLQHCSCLDRSKFWERAEPPATGVQDTHRDKEVVKDMRT